MKVFKTILWTSLFWILLLGGIWVASFWEAKAIAYIKAILPDPVVQDIYNEGMKQGFENAKLEWACPICESLTGTTDESLVSEEILSQIPETCKTFYDGCNTCNRWEDGEIACTVMLCETQGEPKCLDKEATTWTRNQIFPAGENLPSQASADELTTLQNKVAELEKNHWALVQELQAIFSTPEGMKLLPAPTPVAN